MRLEITKIHTTPQTITLTKKEYNTLKHKAIEYDKIITTRSAHMRTYNNNLTPQERKEKPAKPLTSAGTRIKMKTNEKDIKDSILNLYGEPTIYENQD